MPDIAVFGRPSGEFAMSLSRLLCERNCQKNTRIFPLDRTYFYSNQKFDVVLWRGPGTPRQSGARIDTGTLVSTAEDAPRALRFCTADVVLTVGYGSRDTIALSSALKNGEESASLQREITSISGGDISPQELDLSGLSGSLTDKMLLSTALLLCNRESAE